MWAVNLNILYKYENIIHTCYISYETLSLPCAPVAEMSISYIKRLIVSLKKKLHQKKGDVCNKQLSNTFLVATSMSWRQSSVIGDSANMSLLISLHMLDALPTVICCQNRSTNPLSHMRHIVPVYV